MSERAKALQQYLQQWGGEPFSWSRRNCCHFSAGWVQRCTGVDHLQGIAPVAGPRGALRLLRQHGGSLQAAVDARLQPILPALAQVGDLVLLPIGGIHAVGICAGRMAAMLAVSGEVVHQVMGDAVAGWRVGC